MSQRKARSRFALECSECGQRNYTATKNRATTPEKLVLKKYCPVCQKHTEHREGK